MIVFFLTLVIIGLVHQISMYRRVLREISHLISLSNDLTRFTDRIVSLAQYAEPIEGFDKDSEWVEPPFYLENVAHNLRAIVGSSSLTELKQKWLQYRSDDHIKRIMLSGLSYSEMNRYLYFDNTDKRQVSELRRIGTFGNDEIHHMKVEKNGNIIKEGE